MVPKVIDLFGAAALSLQLITEKNFNGALGTADQIALERLSPPPPPPLLSPPCELKSKTYDFRLTSLQIQIAGLKGLRLFPRQGGGHHDGLRQILQGGVNSVSTPTPQPVAQRHQMVSSSLALLLFIGLDLPLGSRAAAPIGDEVL